MNDNGQKTGQKGLWDVKPLPPRLGLPIAISTFAGLVDGVSPRRGDRGGLVRVGLPRRSTRLSVLVALGLRLVPEARPRSLTPALALVDSGWSDHRRGHFRLPVRLLLDRDPVGTKTDPKALSLSGVGGAM
jgi:hypothetical protein